jgi:two-component system, sensor histidine kinase
MAVDDAIPVELEDIDTHPHVGAAKILVVDDTPANLVAAEVALAPLNRQIVTAGSGQDALGHLLEQEFALVLLDVNMPGMDGYETARWIRSREKTQHLPIIFVTAHDHDHQSVLRAYALGAVDFLFKPIIPEILCAKASVFVALQERTEQLASERIGRELENRKRNFETEVLRREREREAAAMKELSHVNTALAELDRRKDSFIAILAHELRNPLAPLRTFIDLVRDQPADLTPGAIDMLERQTKQLVRLVDDLLDLTRIKADKIELRPEPSDLRAIVDDALATSRPVVDQRAHILAVHAPDAPVKVTADTSRLVQVVSNLVNNAARYTDRGGRIDVTVGHHDEASAFVRVRDNGMGIPAELQDTIFHMFVQERVRSDGSGGLGLGLALSRRLVELHRGTIHCESAGANQGSTFEIRVPREGSPLALSPYAVREPPARAPHTVRTVVVDDNQDARELVSDLLRRRGYEVMTAADGPSGVGMIRDHRPDVALVDLGLPMLDGYGVVAALRRECPDLKTRLVALTGYGQTADQERTKQAGFHAHLVKPASAAAIFACLAQQLAET